MPATIPLTPQLTHLFSLRPQLLLPHLPKTRLDDRSPHLVRRYLRRPLLHRTSVCSLSLPSLLPPLTPNQLKRPWFHSFLLLELLYHIPLSLWAIPALLRADPRVPLALLVFGLETSMTTLVCLAEMLSWEELSAAQKGLQGLGGMYGAYLGVGKFVVSCLRCVEMKLAFLCLSLLKEERG